MCNRLISLKNIEFAYPKGNFRIFCNQADFYAGQVALITGGNGSGKTTLSKLMCGILRPDKGALFINGEHAVNWPLGKIGKTVGYLFQEPAQQLFTATVWEEMTFIDEINGIDPSITGKKAEEILNQFGLLSHRNSNTFRLSRGEKQRLALCAILMQGAKFLILDEPTTGLDRENKAILYQIIERLCADGIGFAIISHDNELKSRFSAVKVEVQDGRVIDENT